MNTQTIHITSFFAKKPARTRAIIALSTLPHQTDEDSLVHVSEPNAPIHSYLIYPLVHKTLKTIAVPLFAMSSSLSLPILIILLHKKLNKQSHSSLEQNVLQLLIPYVALVTLRTWLLWNSVGHRLSGHLDAEMRPADDQSRDDTCHVLIALLANTASFTSAFLAFHLIFSDGPHALLWTGAIGFGALNYSKELFTELMDAFRKHAESKRELGQPIQPFLKQKYMVAVCHYAEYVGLVLRECLPLLTGIIHARATTKTVTSILANRTSHQAITAINIPLGSLIYLSCAYLTRFDLAQFRDNMQAAGKPFVINNLLSLSPVFLARLLGKISSGQLLIDLLKRLKLSTSVSVNITLMLAAIGFMALSVIPHLNSGFRRSRLY